MINAADLLKLNTAENVNLDDFDLLLNVNVRSVVELMKLAIPCLKQSKGNILNLSSIYADRCPINYFVYSLATAVVNQLTKCAARELAPSGVRVNAIAAGTIKNPSEEQCGTCSSADEKNNRQSPIGRLGEVNDISAAIEYLVSDSASFVTGIILTVDGGESNGGNLLVE